MQPIMEMNLSTKFTFGKYEGLTLQQVYHGTLNLDRKLLRMYLDKILNNRHSYIPVDFCFQFIEEFVVTQNTIQVVGTLEPYDVGKDAKGYPITHLSRIVLGNIQSLLKTFINYHFSGNWLGIIEPLQTFNAAQETRCVLGADPQYLAWCIRNVDSFVITEDAINALKHLSIARLTGIEVHFVKDGLFEYAPVITTDSYTFTDEILKLNKNKVSDLLI
jgi:hypothetical protein